MYVFYDKRWKKKIYKYIKSWKKVSIIKKN